MDRGHEPDAQQGEGRPPAAVPSPVSNLVGVYDADGSLRGEISYWVGARFGRRHCALCDITHGTFREKRGWQEVCDSLPIPFTAVHLDERDPAVERASRGHEPCVVAVRADGSAEVAVDSEQLERCDGDPARLGELLENLSASRNAGSVMEQFSSGGRYDR
jgi:hypothetical protein